ncbi:MAG: hypothetical protein ABSE92_17365 [Terriglobales bacterium]|jgi:hypothetical protein
MNVDLECMAIEMPHVAGHPNREPFRGVLTILDAVSDRAPSGSRGHRVVLLRGAAERALPSLLGMALDYSPGLDRHDAQRKIGVITRADVVGHQLEIGGFLYAKDFPQIVRDIARSGGKPSWKRDVRASFGLESAAPTLGMSFEIAGANVADMKAKVWTLTHVVFTGAAVLRREKAAYRNTWIELG